MIVLSLGFLGLSVFLLRRARQSHAAMRATLLKCLRLREEINLVIDDNDRLRREGVWFDARAKTWRARYVVEVADQTDQQAYVALAAAIIATAKGWPSSPAVRAN